MVAGIATYYGGPFAGAAVVGFGNSVTTQLVQTGTVDFTKVYASVLTGVVITGITMGLVQGISDAFTRAVPKVPVNTVSELTPVGVVSNQTNGTIATATGIKTTTNVVTETISDASEELTKSGIVRITDGAQKFNCTNCGIVFEGSPLTNSTFCSFPSGLFWSYSAIEFSNSS